MKTLILHITKEDAPFLPSIKPLLSHKANVRITTVIPITSLELVTTARQHGACGVATTSLRLLELLVPEDKRPKISNYAGSIIKKHGVEFLILDPLKNIHTVSEGKFILSRFISKLLNPEDWIKLPEFKWELFNPAQVEEYLSFFGSSTFLSVDIETIRDDPDRAIECISFTAVRLTSNKGEELVFETVVVPFDSMFNVLFVKRVCALSLPKLFQNGKYDIAYLLRFGCPVTNYLLDTLNFFHCWLSELPKDLGFIASMMVRDYSFHKEEGSGGEKYARYSYNAKDTYYTAGAALALLSELPSYAINNWKIQFPVVFPCILCEHTGSKLDTVAFERNKKLVEQQSEKELSRLRVLVANPDYNPNSWQQTQKLFHILGSKDIKSTDEKARDKVAFRHPLNSVILKRIDAYKENSKENSSYYKDTVNWLGRIFYSLNPTGTDTGRLSSRESSFWCGLQIQNIKRDVE